MAREAASAGVNPDNNGEKHSHSQPSPSIHYFYAKQFLLKRWTYRLLQPFIILFVIIITGIVGFSIIGNHRLLQAAYMTVLTITTTGFEEASPLSDGGRIFTMILLIASWASFAFVITRITQFVTSGEINKYFKTRKLMSAIDKLKEHVIICGYGRNGQQAAFTLQGHNVPFVIVEKDERRMESISADDPSIIFLIGDATEDWVLKKAGIHRAKALITALPDDADNVFIVLSARSLSDEIKIISRASNHSSVSKLKKAGANNVIMPDRIGGEHMATLVSKPDVIEFIDFLSSEDGQPIHIESVDFDYLPGEIKNRSLNDVMSWKKTGVNCIGVKDKDGKFVINPPGDVIIAPGMKVIVLGTKLQIDEMKGNLGEE